MNILVVKLKEDKFLKFWYNVTNIKVVDGAINIVDNLGEDSIKLERVEWYEVR